MLCLLLLIPPISEPIAKVIGWTGDKLRAVAQTVAGICVGIVLVLFGIAAAGAALPVLGGIMIIAGLGMMAWNVWPLFQSSSPAKVTVTTNG